MTTLLSTMFLSSIVSVPHAASAARARSSDSDMSRWSDSSWEDRDRTCPATESSCAWKSSVENPLSHQPFAPRPRKHMDGSPSPNASVNSASTSAGVQAPGSSPSQSRLAFDARLLEVDRAEFVSAAALVHGGIGPPRLIHGCAHGGIGPPRLIHGWRGARHELDADLFDAPCRRQIGPPSTYADATGSLA